VDDVDVLLFPKNGLDFIQFSGHTARGKRQPPTVTSKLVQLAKVACVVLK